MGVSLILWIFVDFRKEPETEKAIYEMAIGFNFIYLAYLAHLTSAKFSA